MSGDNIVQVEARLLPEPAPIIADLPADYFWIRRDHIPDTDEECRLAFNRLYNMPIPGIQSWMTQRRAAN